MAWIGSNKDTHEDLNAVCDVLQKKPPTNLTEFLSAEGLDDWPLHMSFENPLCTQSDSLLNGAPDDIDALLEEMTPLMLCKLNDIEKKLMDLEDRLNLYANQMLKEGKKTRKLSHSPSRVFMTQAAESDAKKSQGRSKEHNNLELLNTLLLTKSNRLDYIMFPGYVHGEVNKLPAQLEASSILHCVSNALKLNKQPGYRKFWNNTFLSKASCAVFQDSFWWIFLDQFNKEIGFEQDKDFLFDRIAENYTALFSSMNADYKDSFLFVYPDSLSQALYCTYTKAFPESKWRFNEEFKQYLVNLIHQWVVGIHPLPDSWKKWNEDALQIIQDDDTTKIVLEAISAHGKNIKLDMDFYVKVIAKLGTSDFDLLQNDAKASGNTALSSQLESHQIGPGPEYKHVKFNISGCSPLITHYLHMLHLRSDEQPGVKVKRTEIVKFPPDGPTYQQFIASTLNKSEALSKEYTKIREQTYMDILDLKRQQRDTNKELNTLKKTLTKSKNLHERNEAIDAIKEYNKSLQKCLPLLEGPLQNTESDSSSSCDEEGE